MRTQQVSWPLWKSWGSEPLPNVCGIEDEEPLVAIEELLPIRVHHIVEQEFERPGAVGVVTTRQSSEGVLADPESSLSDVTDSPPESDYEEEAESESSDCLLYTSPSPRD